jgi:hypothetical protein
MFYTISATIDDEVYVVATNVPDDELEGELQHLTRRHAFKNVVRFEITQEIVLDHSPILK